MNIQDFYTNIFCKYPLVSTDSRQINENSIFFALQGAAFNGNEYALDAIKQGAAYAVVDDISLANKPRCVYVENVLTYLQNIATFHRKQFSIPVIGITGTNGKTTTKELIATVLSQKYNVCFTQGNLNNHIGVPLSLLKITSDTEIAIIEMGANHHHEIDFLCRIAEPNYGIITNIGKAHLEGFGSFETVIATKTEMYRYIAEINGTIFQDFDNEILQKHSPSKTDIICYGYSKKASYIGEIKEHSIFAKFTFSNHKKTIDIQSQLFGEYNVKNMLAAATIGSYFSIEFDIIKEAIENYTPSNNRSQQKKTKTNTLILDAYNANPTSMRAALEQFVKIQNQDTCVILGEMYELGPDAEKEHTAILDFINSHKISQVFLVGKWEKHSNTSFTYFRTAHDLLEYLQSNPIENKTILIKGSRGVKLETVVSAL